MPGEIIGNVVTPKQAFLGAVTTDGGNIAAIEEREAVKKSNAAPPAYLEVDLDNLQATLVRTPQIDEIPVQTKIMSVIEYCAR